MRLSFLSESDILCRIAQAMRNRRIALNLTQKEAAERAGISFMTISKFELSGNISLKMLSSLFIAYGMEDKILFSFEDHSWWNLDELKSVEKRKRIKHEQKK